MLVPLRPTSSVQFEQVLRHVQRIIDDEQQRKQLLGTKCDIAQQWLDLFQLLAEYPNVPTALRPSIFKLMIRLSRKSGLHPQCLTIRGVEKLGDYPVGGGAFGDVWKGRVGRQLVCLKVIRAFNRSDVQQILKDYMQEGIIWRQLNHPNVLPFMGIYYLDTKQRQLCLVSPWMEQGNLVEFLKNSNDSVDRVLLAYDVACGLSHLHGANIVHGDLKGANILIRPDLRASIGDFGLARVSATQLLLSETSRSKGTTRWLSPELLRPGPNCVPSKESDVYAYACVCYEISTGKVPLHEVHEAAIVFAVLMDHKRPSRPEFCENLRDSMWDLMQACWKETISLRPTMTDVLIRIEEMNVDRRLEPASNWRNPIFTQIWNDIKRPPVVQTGDSNSSEIGDHDRAGEDLSSDEAHFDPEILSLRQLVNQQEDNGEAWKALGHCYLAHGHLQEAYSAYRQALSLLPNSHEDPKLWYGIGVLYDRYGYLDPAEKAFSWVLAMDEEFDQANEIFFRLGILYKQQGKYEESLRCFDRTLWNPPTPVTPADIWFQIGHVHEQQRNHAQAKHAYERAIDKHPRHAKVLQQLGWLYHQDGSSFQNQDLAIQYFTKSLRADSSDAQSWYLLGRAYMADQKYSQACEAYQQAVYRDDQNPAFWRSIGKLYFQINQFRDAFDAYSRTIKINPYISGVWFDLGLLYEKWNNQISNAIDAYAHSLALDPGNTMISERLQLLKQARVTGGQVPEASGSQDVPAAAYRSSDEFQGMDARGPVGAAGSGSAPANENSLPPPSSSTPSSQSRVNGYGDHTTRSPPGPPPVIFDGRHLQTVQVASMGI